MFQIPNNFRPELRLAAELAERAGKELMRFFGKEIPSAEKTNRTPVTEADYAAEKIIIEGLRAAFSYPILAEETVSDQGRAESEYVWVVDPLDGTRSFIKGEPTFSVLIALTQNGTPLLGAAHFPATGELYFAEQGKGAHLAQEKRLCQIRASEKSAPSELRVLVSNELFANPASLHAFGFRTIERMGGFSAKALAVAAGRADLYINLDAKGSEWDTCAPEIIVREAGGVVTDIYGRKLPYNQANPARADGEIVSNSPTMHEKVLRELMPILIKEFNFPK